MPWIVNIYKGPAHLVGGLLCDDYQSTDVKALIAENLTTLSFRQQVLSYKLDDRSDRKAVHSRMLPDQDFVKKVRDTQETLKCSLVDAVKAVLDQKVYYTIITPL